MLGYQSFNRGDREKAQKETTPPFSTNPPTAGTATTATSVSPEAFVLTEEHYKKISMLIKTPPIAPAPASALRCCFKR
jgi:hypothetical protein